MTKVSTTRNQEIQKVHSEYADFYQIGSGVMLVFVGILIGAFMFKDGYAANVYTEILSVFITILVLDRLNDLRDKRNYRHLLKRQIRSTIETVAVNALDELRLLGLHKGDGSVLVARRLSRSNWYKANLQNANLQGSDLDNIDLRYSRLIAAKLNNTNLRRANFTGAELPFADMKDSFLGKANLSDTDLIGADLENAVLIEAKLSGACLLQTNLKNVNLSRAVFDIKTVLPDADINHSNEDGKPIFDKYWTPDTDMTRYTDPNHPDFWQPEWAKNQK